MPQVSPTVRLLKKLRAQCRPPKRETVLEWSIRERVLAGGVSAIEGRFKPLPWQNLMLEAITQRKYSEHVWMLAAQTGGKTECILNVVGYFISAEPSPVMIVYPTLDAAKTWSKKKLARMIQASPVIKKLIRESRTRDSGNTTLSKEFPGGDLVIAGSNSPPTLRGTSRRVVIQDEIDSYEASAGSEGDPCALADVRAENYPNAVFIKSSTPTIKGLSRIEKLYEDSTQHEFYVACPHCQKAQTLRWSCIKWEDGKPETAHYVCASCEKPWTDSQRIRAIWAGDWVAAHPHHSRLGLKLSGIYRIVGLKDTYRSFPHEFAAKFLKAKESGDQAMKAWQNTFLCETYEEQAYRLDHADIMGRCENYDVSPALPKGILIVTAGADVQGDRIEVEFIGWGADEESWGIEKIVLVGDPDKEEVWARLDECLLKKYRSHAGAELKVERAFIDMQFKTDRVLKFCAPRVSRGVYPCRGISRTGLNLPPILAPRPSTNNKLRVPHWNIGVTLAKSLIYDRLKLPVPGARSMHFPEGYGYDQEHFKQLTAENVKIKYSYGQAYYVFEKEHNAIRNEALDIRVYGYAALASLMPINWKKLGENIEKKEKISKDELKKMVEPLKPEPKAEEAKPLEDALAAQATAKKPFVGHRFKSGGRKSFVGGWR